MIRRLTILAALALALVVSHAPEALAAKKGKSRLTLRQPGTELTRLTVQTGSTVTGELYIEGRGEQMTGAVVFLTFDDRYLELIPPRYLDGNPVPFTSGNHLSGRVYRNDTLDDKIGDSNANKLPMFQMTYQEQINPGATGDQRSVAGDGILARFTVRVIGKPAAGTTTIRYDAVSPTGSESGYFIKDDGGTVYSFESVEMMSLTIQGLQLSVRLPDISLLPGQVDSTLDLDDYINDPVTPDSAMVWAVGTPSPDSIDVDINPASRRVIIDPRIVQGVDTTSFIGVATVPFSVTDPFGSVFRDTIRVIVSTPPSFNDAAIPDTVRFLEDGRDTSLVLSVTDPDPGSGLVFTSPDTGTSTFASVNDATGRVTFTAKANYFGEEVRRFIVEDEYGVRDTTAVRVIVDSVNDPPEFIKPFNGVTVGALGQVTLNIPEYVRDVDDGLEALRFAFSGADSIAFSVSPGNQRMTITPVPPFMGARTVNVVVTDPSNAPAIQPITVSILPPGDPQAPRVIVESLKMGVRAGSGASAVLLDTLVTDLDTPVSSLIWTRSTVRLVSVDAVALATTRRLRVTAQPDSVGYAPMTLTVTDPTNLRDTLPVRLYVASPVTGIPVIGGLPDVTIAAGASDTLNLDDYYFDADHTDAQVTWTASGQSQVQVDIDPTDHQLVLSAPQSVVSAQEDIILTVTDPVGNSASDTMRVTVLDQNAVGIDLSSLGGVYTVTLGIPDTLDLAPYLALGSPSRVKWGALSRGPSRLFAQPQGPSELLLIGLQLGETRVVLTATDTVSGNVATDSLRVTVRDPNDQGPNLSLRPIGALTLTTNKDSVLSLRSYVTSGSTANLVWTSSANQNVNVVIDSLDQEAILRPVEGFLGNAGPIVFTAMDEVTGQSAQTVASPITVQGQPTNQNPGLFKVSLVVNPIRKNFLDAFVISRRALVAEPFLGFKLGTDTGTKPNSLTVSEVERVTDVWVGDFVISDQTTGTVLITATGIDANTRVALTDTLRLIIANGGITSSFRVAHEDVEVELPAGGMTGRSKVAVFATEDAPGSASKPIAQDGLVQVSRAYRVHAPTADVAERGSIRIRTPESGKNIGVYRRVSGTWVPVPSRPGNGFVEGQFEAFGVYALFERTAPTDATLYANYPNPFNPQTVISFDVGRETNVRLEIFNLLGQRVRLLVSEWMAPGRYRMSWDARDDLGRDVAAGVYVTRLVTAQGAQMKKMLYLK